MEAALGGYKAAADYRVAEVTTVATYEIAEIYRQLGKDIMKSERPKKLAAEQLDEYNSLLEEQAFPFEEQAISTHEINTKRVRDNVYDEGVKKSYAALAELKPGRYAKTEVMSASFDALVPPLPPAPALPDPPIAAPADPTAKPVNPAATRARRAGVQCSQAAGARQLRIHARAHADARQRCHAGHSRDAGAHAVISGPAGAVREPGCTASQCQPAGRVGSRAGQGHRTRALGCADLDRIRNHAAPGGQVRRGTRGLRTRHQGESFLRSGAPQSGCAARPVPRRSAYRSNGVRDLQDTDGRRQAGERLAGGTAGTQQGAGARIRSRARARA